MELSVPFDLSKQFASFGKARDVALRDSGQKQALGLHVGAESIVH
jgi:hypothetical protein